MNQIENVKNATGAQISVKFMKVYFYFECWQCLVQIAQLCNYQIEHLKFHRIVTHISAIIVKVSFLFS